MATVHKDDITIGGERSAVELLIRKISRNDQIKKQVIGDDTDLEKSGRILNRVIEWGGDGVTIEAEQRHVREMLKGLELERADHTATPCAVESKNEGNARNDDGKGGNRRGRRQAQTTHEWDDVNEGDDRYRPQMADDDDNDSQALTGGDITRYTLVARISYLSRDRPNLKFASMQVCCAMAKPSVRDVERVERIGRYFFGKPRAGSVGSRVASWMCARTLTEGPHGD